MGGPEREWIDRDPNEQDPAITTCDGLLQFDRTAGRWYLPDSEIFTEEDEHSWETNQ